jgi:SAM-dependent methyltransferase
LNNDCDKDIWNANSQFWDIKMGEGNEFHKSLIEPVQLKLLNINQGERILDLACGNGQFARKMAVLGAYVTATDFAENMIEIAKAKSSPGIQYEIVDITLEADLEKLAGNSYDKIVCTMALMDVPDIKPLANYLSKLLKAGGVFVFSTIHPCFNSGKSVMVHENGYIGSDLTDTYSIKTSDYLVERTNLGVAMIGQPEVQHYFHRPLGILLGSFFDAGMVLDALVEPSFTHLEQRDKLFTNVFRNIPPALICRLRFI